MKYMPILAILTGLFEISFAVYFIELSKKTKRIDIRILVAILFLLSSYQLLEAYNCTINNLKAHNPQGPFLVRLSFLFITWLPALGIYFGYVKNPKKNIMLRIIAYLFLGLASFFSVWFIVYGDSASIKVCKSVIAIYSNRYPLYQLYGAYYQLGMLLMLIFSVISMAKENNLNDRLMLQDFILGSILFIVPSLVITTVFPQHRESVPSIMCHIALFLGVFIVKTLFREGKLLKNYETK